MFLTPISTTATRTLLEKIVLEVVVGPEAANVAYRTRSGEQTRVKAGSRKGEYWWAV